MTDQEIINNAPEGSTHVAFANFEPEVVKYLQTDTDVINNWYHWVNEDKHTVDFEFTVVFDNMRALSDIRNNIALLNQLDYYRNKS
jgi:hypothetical protein